MADQTHRRAMERVDGARAALSAGRVKKARDLFEEAADLEERAVEALSSDTPRTRGILCVSAVSMRREAGELARARELARRYLDEGLSPGFAREMHVLLAEIDDDLRSLAAVPTIDESRAAEVLQELERLEEQIAAGRIPRIAVENAA